jgi:hypothetical protein
VKAVSGWGIEGAGMKKTTRIKGCFLFQDQFSSFCFSSLDTAVNR